MVIATTKNARQNQRFFKTNLTAVHAETDNARADVRLPLTNLRLVQVVEAGGVPRIIEQSGGRGAVATTASCNIIEQKLKMRLFSPRATERCRR
jgi:hypothetical protein